MTIRKHLLPLVASLLLPLGCGTTDPAGSAPGHYQLESVGNDSLPATLYGGGVLLQFEVLTLESGGRAVMESVTRNVIAGVPGEEIRSIVEGTWSIEDSRLFVVLPTRHLEYRIEDGGRSLRLEAGRNTGPDFRPDVFYEFVYRRVS